MAAASSSMFELPKMDSKLLLPFATCIIALGGFPSAPKMWTDFAKNPLFQYAALFVLVWQGGAEQNISTALFTSAVFFAVITLIKTWEQKQALVMVAAPPAHA